METLTVRSPFARAEAISILSITGVSVTVRDPLLDRGFFPEPASGEALAGEDLEDSVLPLLADLPLPFAALFLADDFLDEDFFLAISRFRFRPVAPQVNKIPRFAIPTMRRKTAYKPEIWRSIAVFVGTPAPGPSSRRPRRIPHLPGLRRALRPRHVSASFRTFRREA